MKQKTIAETLYERFCNVAATPDELLLKAVWGGYGLPPTNPSSGTTALQMTGPAITPANFAKSLKRVRDNLYCAVEEDKATAAGVADRLAAHMREKVFHPEQGALLIVPAKHAHRFPLFYLPPYVRFSNAAEHVYMVANPLNLTEPTFTIP